MTANVDMARSEQLHVVSPVQLAHHHICLPEESKSEGLSRSADDAHEPFRSLPFSPSVDDGRAEASNTVAVVSWVGESVDHTFIDCGCGCKDLE